MWWVLPTALLFAYEMVVATQRLSLPSTVTSIGFMAFANSMLNAVTVPRTVEEMGSGAFNKCFFLRSAKIEGDLWDNSGVKTIPPYCFSGCTDLEQVDLSAVVNKIGGYAFSGCQSLKKLTLRNPWVPTTTSTTWSGFPIANTALLVAKGTTGKYTASQWQQFKSIGDAPREGFDCNDMGFEIDIYGKQVLVGRNGQLWDFPDYADYPDLFELPATVEYRDRTYPVVGVFKNAFNGITLNQVELPHGYTIVEDSAFYNSNLSGTMILPNSIKTIESYAFGKNRITEIGLPDDLTSIGEGAFEFTSLTSLYLPQGVTHIPDYLLFDCDNLKKLYIGNRNNVLTVDRDGSPVLTSTRASCMSTWAGQLL